MAHSDCSDYSAFTSCKLQNELALKFRLWFEDREWGTSESAAPIGEFGIGRSIRDCYWLK